jgi:hypothetical protein
MNLSAFSTLAVTYWPVILIVGIVLTFLGYYLLRISMAVIGLIAGAYLGEYIWMNFIIKNFSIPASDAKTIQIVVILIIAFLVTSLFIALYKFALFMLGFIAGGAIVYYIYNWIISAMNIDIGKDAQWVKIGVFVVFGFVFGILTSVNEKRTVGTAMAAIGALITAFSIMIPTSVYFDVKQTEVLNALSDGKHIMMVTAFVVIFLALSVLSVAIQSGIRRGRKVDSKSQR